MHHRRSRYGLHLLLALGLATGLLGCDWTGPGARETLVVEAFLETRRPLPTIVLRRTQPLSAGDSAARWATGADLSLRLNGTQVPYAAAERPGRYVPAATDTVTAAAPWRLQVRWNGETARAAGTTPPPLRLTEVCVDVPSEPVRAVEVDSLRRDSLDIPARRSFIYPIEVEVRWAGPEDPASYWVRTRLRPDTTQFESRLVGRFLQPADVRPEARFGRNGSERRWRGVYAVPVDSASAPLPAHRLVSVAARGDSAFGAFARTRTDPDLREPVSNVEGGLGIATAVAIDSAARTVGPDLAPRCRSLRDGAGAGI